ncbi:hypothetical protein [Fischerella sp. FACHB-380]|uniref:hypothetical protein n=1 Tax=Fischerella sp. FACHB-380 TaxID=2692799 RepID=UPI001688B852|nr:hypothetical protein [Fischerella sp. FACHB-380]MBD2432953.1 hypothetical protein [Fischerella sp. FACHB-380]
MLVETCHGTSLHWWLVVSCYSSTPHHPITPSPHLPTAPNPQRGPRVPHHPITPPPKMYGYCDRISLEDSCGHKIRNDKFNM